MLNVNRIHDAEATDAVWCDTPAVDDVHASDYVFVDTETLETDVHGIKSDNNLSNAISDNIRKRCAIDKLISNRSQV